MIIKTGTEIKIMQEGGKKLSHVKNSLEKAVKEGISAMEIENLANDLMAKEGGKPSFKMVDGYRWATCVNVNNGVVHGIPKKSIIFKRGDLVSIDVGMFYKGFHTDTSFSVGVSTGVKTNKFIETGKIALKKAISEAKVGKRIWDISNAIETTLNKAGYSPIRSLVGHGVGRELHEDPQIPCFVDSLKRNESPIIPEGAVLAIEVMYTKGGSNVSLSDDGWTINTADGKIAGLFEETVAITKKGSIVLTELDSGLTN
ncbi:MAG: Methionine aminopeptidase [Candidatus Woesebacteria bacterium GW2011_GWB1_38_8]|uniref:Methionine aminopeptidase n=2 Tax=Candidatus Woeseibacteriota TaxID=1752722 RepID=A0A0G0P9J2_9BACT|nr:MAG: Methionine aminopeptidase [Candidatus Woesebacteria bacterium GW2011_GWB1_38_8]